MSVWASFVNLPLLCGKKLSQENLGLTEEGLAAMISDPASEESMILRRTIFNAVVENDAIFKEIQTELRRRKIVTQNAIFAVLLDQVFIAQIGRWVLEAQTSSQTVPERKEQDSSLESKVKKNQISENSEEKINSFGFGLKFLKEKCGAASESLALFPGLPNDNKKARTLSQTPLSRAQRTQSCIWETRNGQEHNLSPFANAEIPENRPSRMSWSPLSLAKSSLNRRSQTNLRQQSDVGYWVLLSGKDNRSIESASKESEHISTFNTAATEGSCIELPTMEDVFEPQPMPKVEQRFSKRNAMSVKQKSFKGGGEWLVDNGYCLEEEISYRSQSASGRDILLLDWSTEADDNPRRNQLDVDWVATPFSTGSDENLEGTS